MRKMLVWFKWKTNKQINKNSSKIFSKDFSKQDIRSVEFFLGITSMLYLVKTTFPVDLVQ